MKNFVNASYNLKKSLRYSSGNDDEDILKSEVCQKAINALKKYEKSYSRYVQLRNSPVGSMIFMANEEEKETWIKMVLSAVDNNYTKDAFSIGRATCLLNFLRYNNILYMSNGMFVPESGLVFQHHFKYSTPKFMWDLCDKNDWNKNIVIKPFKEVNDKYWSLKKKGYEFDKNIELLFNNCKTLNESQNGVMQDGVFYFKTLECPPENYYNK